MSDIEKKIRAYNGLGDYNGKKGDDVIGGGSLSGPVKVDIPGVDNAGKYGGSDLVDTGNPNGETLED
jgi:hypothetical protein